MGSKYTTKRAKSQRRQPATEKKDCAHCHWLRSTKCIDVNECLTKESGESRSVPKFFKQRVKTYKQRNPRHHTRAY